MVQLNVLHYLVTDISKTPDTTGEPVVLLSKIYPTDIKTILKNYKNLTSPNLVSQLSN